MNGIMIEWFWIVWMCMEHHLVMDIYIEFYKWKVNGLCNRNVLMKLYMEFGLNMNIVI